MEPKILLSFLEKEKFSEKAYEEQWNYLQELAKYFEKSVALTMENVSTLFTEYDVRTCICITTSPEIAAQMQGLGISVVGFEADSQEMMQAPYVVLGLDEMTYEELVRIYRRWHKLPWDITKTKRLTIREFCMEDLDALYQLYQKPHVTDFVEPLFEYQQEKIYEQNYIEKIYGFYGFGMWLCFHKETGELVGRVGLEYRQSCQEGELELGYIIDPAYWRQGYAMEACVAVMQYAKEELGAERILCRVSPENQASIGLLKKIGFVLREKQDECIYTYDLVDFS